MKKIIYIFIFIFFIVSLGLECRPGTHRSVKLNLFNKWNAHENLQQVRQSTDVGAEARHGALVSVGGWAGIRLVPKKCRGGGWSFLGTREKLEQEKHALEQGSPINFHNFHRGPNYVRHAKPRANMF